MSAAPPHIGDSRDDQDEIRYDEMSDEIAGLIGLSLFTRRLLFPSMSRM
jgi:hypothetical protein